MSHDQPHPVPVMSDEQVCKAAIPGIEMDSINDACGILYFIADETGKRISSVSYVASRAWTHLRATDERVKAYERTLAVPHTNTQKGGE